MCPQMMMLTFLFQFTHPGRGATINSEQIASTLAVSIHAPREGRDDDIDGLKLVTHVSIHAPREGCDVSLLK